MTKLTTKSVNAKQAKLVSEMIAYFKGETVVTRAQLIEAHGKLRGRKCSPHFIAKNNAAKVKDKTSETGVARDQYNLAVFASSMKAALKRAQANA